MRIRSLVRVGGILLFSVGATLSAGNPASAGASKATTQAVRSWIALHQAVFLSLQTDLSAISRNGVGADTTALATACQQLTADLGTIKQEPPIPNSAVEAHWTEALSELGRGATECVSAIVRRSSTLLKECERHLTSGVRQVDSVVSGLRALEKR